MLTNTKSFIVRIWIEPGSESESGVTWRGVVEQVGSTERFYFQDLERAFQFVQDQAGISLKSDPTFHWWKSFLEWVRHASYLFRFK